MAQTSVETSPATSSSPGGAPSRRDLALLRAGAQGVHRGRDRTVAKDELRMGLAAVDFLEHQRHATLAEDASGVDGHGQDFGTFGETSSGWGESKGGSEAKTIDELGVESGKLGAG